MSEIAPVGHRDIAAFKPGQTREKLARLEGEVVRFRKLRDWPELEQAVDAIMAEQGAFVANWDATVRRKGGEHGYDNTLGHYRSVAEAEAEWGFAQPTVSRWRTLLKSADKYRERLIIGAHRIALLEAEENHRAEGTGDNEWFTPAEYITAARDVMGGIDLDPASHFEAQKTVQAATFHTRKDNGLLYPWHGCIWLNPPYAPPLIGQFVSRLVQEFNSGRTRQAVLLTHNYTDTAWFHEAEADAAALCFTRGRIRFVDIDGEPCSPTQGQCFFYFGDRADRFREFFCQFGFIR